MGRRSRTTLDLMADVVEVMSDAASSIGGLGVWDNYQIRAWLPKRWANLTSSDLSPFARK